MNTDGIDQHGGKGQVAAVSPTQGTVQPPIEYVPLTQPQFVEGRQVAVPATELPAGEFLLQFFEYEHLPEELQTVSIEFKMLASRIVQFVPRNPERTVALRKLLEAKDCAVRAMIAK